MIQPEKSPHVPRIVVTDMRVVVRFVAHHNSAVLVDVGGWERGREGEIETHRDMM